jgi:hypothetical protein
MYIFDDPVFIEKFSSAHLPNTKSCESNLLASSKKVAFYGQKVLI